MAKWEATESRKIAATTADKAEEFEGLCIGAHLIADGDCFVDFNRPATASGSFLIKANIPYHLESIQFSEIHVVTASSTANLYILATR